MSRKPVSRNLLPTKALKAVLLQTRIFRTSPEDDDDSNGFSDDTETIPKRNNAEAACRQPAGQSSAPADPTAMRYSLEAGAWLRPALTLGACEMVCGSDAPALHAVRHGNDTHLLPDS